MAARLIEPTDPIEVKQLCCLAYGQPGSRKSSLAQTAAEPFTIATDPGIYRAFGRKRCALVETWADVLEACTLPACTSALTVCVDTLGMALDKLGAAIIADNPKHGNRMGGLSLQGYGVLKSQFAQWCAALKAQGKDLVFLCHEKAEKNGDETYYCPDIVGGSYNTLMNIADMVGYLHFDGGKRVADFTPSDRWMAKVPPWSRDGRILLPDFAAEPHFLAGLLAEAKASMGRISEASAAIAQAVDAWQAALLKIDTPEQLNALLPGLKDMDATAKRQAWTATERFAESSGLVWDKPTKAFRLKEGAA